MVVGQPHAGRKRLFHGEGDRAALERVAGLERRFPFQRRAVEGRSERAACVSERTRRPGDAQPRVLARHTRHVHDNRAARGPSDDRFAFTKLDTIGRTACVVERDREQTGLPESPKSSTRPWRELDVSG